MCFFPSLRQKWTGSRTAEVSTIIGHASSITREVWGAWVRFFLGDVKDHHTSRVFLSPIHVSCFDCDYVRLLRLGSFPKGQGCHVVFCMDNDFRSVSSDVGCRVRLVNVFFPCLRQNWTGSRTSEVATIVGHEVDPLWVRIF